MGRQQVTGMTKKQITWQRKKYSKNKILPKHTSLKHLYTKQTATQGVHRTRCRNQESKNRGSSSTKITQISPQSSSCTRRIIVVASINNFQGQKHRQESPTSQGNPNFIKEAPEPFLSYQKKDLIKQPLGITKQNCS